MEIVSRTIFALIKFNLLKVYGVLNKSSTLNEFNHVQIELSSNQPIEHNFMRLNIQFSTKQRHSQQFKEQPAIETVTESKTYRKLMM